MTPTTDRQLEAIREALAVFLRPGQVTELRALGVGSTRAVTAFYRDPEALARRAAELDGQGARGVYFVPNPLRPDLVPEESPSGKGSARKADIIARHWLLIDCDPVRFSPDGVPLEDQAVPSTESEREAAWNVLDRCKGTLDATGLRGAVVGDSGNGWHLCYPVDLPADDQTQEQVKALLKGLQKRCGDPTAKVDPSTHDAPRIWKLYGTTARKGPDTPDRPHRVARLIEGSAPTAELAASNNALLSRLLGLWTRQDELRNPSRSTFSGREAVIARAKLYLTREPPAISGQGGHNQCFHAACILVHGFALSEEEAFEAIQDWNRTCKPPWSAGELRHKLADAAKQPGPRGTLLNGGGGPNGHAAGSAGPSAGHDSSPGSTAPTPEPWEPIVPLSDVPRPQPFPVDILPPALQPFVSQAAWAVNCPPDFIGVPLLAVAGGCVGNSRRLLITRTHAQSACLFAGVVGSPGSAKSPALDLVVEPLEQAQVRYLDQWKAELKTCPQPVLRRCVVDDTTTEALVDRLEDNPRGVVMVRRELAALVTGMNQYRQGGRGHDRQVYLKLWAHEAIHSDRKSNPGGVPVCVRRPFVSVVGAIQPAVVDQLRGDHEPGKPAADDGFLDRFLFVWPPDLPAVEEQWREVEDAVSAAWDQAVRSLLDLAMTPGEHGPRPHALHLTACGKVAWIRFTREHAAEVNDPDFPDFLRGAWAKLRGYCGRLALVIHCLREACGETLSAVDGDSMDRAALLVGYFKSHARKMYAAMDADPLVAAARHVLRWVTRERRTEFKRWEVYEDVKSRGRFPRLADLDAPLALLTRHHFLRLRVEAKRQGPGRPSSPVYEVNPSIGAPDNPGNPGNDLGGEERPNESDHSQDKQDSPDAHESNEWEEVFPKESTAEDGP